MRPPAEPVEPSRAAGGAARADAFLRLIERSKRGRLKVYLGYSPGVGKTYRMLQEAHALKGQGVDVVVGYVEDHGREETQALVDGLEAVARRRETYRGVPLEEMDLDAVLARAPAVALVDELAHTNVPGSRHKKRYQDVLALLDAGVHVVTTLNVQHLESLYETVERITGVKVKERVPDWVLAEADQVVNVDLAAEDLRARLGAGKVYPEARARAALAHFFTPSNLEHLRNLTLRQTASAIEGRGRQAEAERVAAPDQVVVCLSSKGPDSEALLRYGSRLAGRLNRTWYALHVQGPRDAPERVDARAQRVLSNVLALASTLGATVFTYKGEDAAQTILRFAREYGAGHVVIGKGRAPTWWDRLLGRRTVQDRLIGESDGLTVVVVDTSVAGGPAASGAEPSSEPAPGRPSGPAPDDAPQALGAPRPRLASFLARDGVVVWEEPVTKEEALRTLTERAARRAGLDAGEALRRVWARERAGSTLVGDGLALPHARIAGLGRPAVALGVPRGGLTGVPEGEAIEAVWLLLLPEITAGFLPTAAVARASRSDALRNALRHGTAAEIRAALERTGQEAL
jgi:two-component system sensor histidine kinase KdpD